MIEAHRQGLKILFLNHIPEIVVNDDLALCSSLQIQLRQMPTITPNELGQYLWNHQIYDIKLIQPDKNLLYYHYDVGQQIYFLFNTSLHCSINTEVMLPKGHYYAQDVWNQCEYSVCETTKGEKTFVPIKLRPYESILLRSSDKERPSDRQTFSDHTQMNVPDISYGWKFSKATASQYPQFEPCSSMEILQPISDIAPQFSGVMRYEKEICLPSEAAKVLFCPQYIYEAAEVFVNRKSAGKQLIPVYEWDITDLLQEGNNHILIEVANTPARDTLKKPGIFGPDRAILEPSGMFGKVEIKWYRSAL